MNVLLIRASQSYAKMFQRHGWDVIYSMGELPEKVEVDLICFTGGTDVNPKMYNHSRHRFTSSSDVSRDETEAEIFKKARKRGIPMVGICRGAQFLCVMNGGTLYQHVSNHNGPHTMVTSDGERIGVSSTHHQMMNPKSGRLVGWAEGLSKTYEGEFERVIQPPANRQEPEAVYWEDTKCFAAQFHPEYFQSDLPAVKFFFEYVKEVTKK